MGHKGGSSSGLCNRLGDLNALLQEVPDYAGDNSLRIRLS